MKAFVLLIALAVAGLPVALSLPAKGDGKELSNVFYTNGSVTNAELVKLSDMASNPANETIELDGPCPRGWKLYSSDDRVERCLLRRPPMTYEGALGFCTGRNSTIVKINSPEDNIRFLNATEGKGDIWISNSHKSVTSLWRNAPAIYTMLIMEPKCEDDCCHLFLEANGNWSVFSCSANSTTKSVLCTATAEELVHNQPEEEVKKIGKLNVFFQTTPPKSEPDSKRGEEKQQASWLTAILAVVFGVVAIAIVAFFLRSKCGNSGTLLQES